MKSRPRSHPVWAAAIAVFAALALFTAPARAATLDPWDPDAPAKKAVPPQRNTAPASDADSTRKARVLEESRKVLGKGGDAGLAANSDATPADAAWTIALVVFRGQTADEGARLALHKVQSEGTLPSAFSERRAESVIVACGRFDSPDSARASSELKRIQQITVAGSRPFKDALLIPPVSGVKLGSMPQLNLIQTRKALGKSALYTLQVAVYGRRDLARPADSDLAEARRAAEQAALRLRQEGEQAFYYHGPRMSMVTVGVFDETDYDPQTPTVQSARLRDARQRNPYNLYNGAGIRERIAGDKDGRMQASSLVAVPEK